MAPGRHFGDRPIAAHNSSSLVVFTDLDGTLLDHDTYDWSPAATSLETLKRRDIPVILISSKTLAELREYRSALALPYPVVAENGAAVDVPEGALAVTWQGHGITREHLKRALTELRGELKVQCCAFFELGVDGIVAATGLSPEQAALANTRDASEPLLWQDTPEALIAFTDAAGERGLRCVRGGRFVHLMAPTDKSQAMAQLVSAYSTLRGSDVTSLALGDSANDLGMLKAADIAVVIPGQGTGASDMIAALDGHPHLVRARLPGPSGWHDAVQSILNQMDTEIVNVG
ncbi:MAG: HAD-IIB family hydrolase [Pseudomonadota bacterium]